MSARAAGQQAAAAHKAPAAPACCMRALPPGPPDCPACPSPPLAQLQTTFRSSTVARRRSARTAPSTCDSGGGLRCREREPQPLPLGVPLGVPVGPSWAASLPRHAMPPARCLLAAPRRLMEVHHWISTHLPYWDRNGGRDHIVVSACWGRVGLAVQGCTQAAGAAARQHWALAGPSPTTRGRSCCLPAAPDARRGLLLAALGAAPRHRAVPLGSHRGPRQSRHRVRPLGRRPAAGCWRWR